MKFFSALLAAIAIFDFILEIAREKLTLKKFLCFLSLFILSLFAYFLEDMTGINRETIPNSYNSSAIDQSQSQALTESMDITDISSSSPSDDFGSNQPTESLGESPEKNEDSEEDSVKVGTPFVEATPRNQITSAYLSTWDIENDHDIIGNTYPAAIKLTVSNMIDSIFGYGESEISADVHFPFGEKISEVWNFSFVVTQEMVGNGSSAKITILADGIELYPTFSLSSTTTEDLTYSIPLDGIRDLVLHFECTAVGNGFYAGIVLDDSVAE